MYNHKVKKVKFLFSKSKLLKSKSKTQFESICVFFLENAENNLIKFTSKIKRSFFLNLQSNYWHKDILVGGGIINEKLFSLKDSLKEFSIFIKKQKSCIIFYAHIYWTLSKIIKLNLEKNSMGFLVLFLSNKLKKTLSFFLPLKSFLVNLKVKSGK